MIVTRRVLCAAAVLAAARLPSGGAAWAAVTAAITIDDFTFTPVVLAAAVGTAVTWTNHDDIPHTIIGVDPGQALKSPVLDTDDVFTFTFAKAGTYNYFCSLHPHMQGAVIVKCLRSWRLRDKAAGIPARSARCTGSLLCCLPALMAQSGRWNTPAKSVQTPWRCCIDRLAYRCLS